MSRFLFLLFLVSFLFLADAAPYTLTGELQSWTSGDPDFGVATAQTYGTIFSNTLDLLGKPTYVGIGIASISNFYSWWNTPISKQNNLTPFSIVMNDGGSSFNFSRPTGFFPISGVSVFSFHVRGELNCVTTCSPSLLSVTTSDDFAMYVNGALVCQITGVRTLPTIQACTITGPGGLAGTAYTHYVDIFYARRSTVTPAALVFQLPGSATTCSIFSRSLLTRYIYPFGPSNVQPFSNAIFFGNASDQQPILVTEITPQCRF
jgi:hypothetical protein